MKRKSKGFLITLLLAIMTTTSLTACSKKDGNGAAEPQESAKSSQAASAEQSPEASPALEPYKITMFVPGTAAPKDQALVNEEISKYLKDKINASFELNVIEWASWGDKMNLKFAGNEPFDLIWTVNWDNFAGKIESKAIVDMTDLIDQYAADAKAIIDPTLLEGSKYKGRNYSLPVNKEIPSQRGLQLRKDLVEKYQIDVSKITKLEDMEPIYETIKKNEPGVSPLFLDKSISIMTILDASTFDPLGDGPGKLFRGSTDFKVVDEYDQPVLAEQLDLARKWYLAGFVNKDAATNTGLDAAIKAGKVFSYPEYLKPGKDAEATQKTGIEWVQVPLTKPIVTTGDTTGSMMSISRTSKDPARAAMFLNLLYTDKTLVNLLSFGIEGKHYVKTSDNVIDFPEGVKADTSGYNLGTAWMFGNQFNNYLWANEDPQKWDKFKQFNESADSSQVLGFTFNPENVKNEIAAINNVLPEYQPGLYSGTIDPKEQLPKFIAKLKSVGLDKVLAEKQKQVDSFIAEKGQ